MEDSGRIEENLLTTPEQSHVNDQGGGGGYTSEQQVEEDQHLQQRHEVEEPEEMKELNGQDTNSSSPTNDKVVGFRRGDTNGHGNSGTTVTQRRGAAVKQKDVTSPSSSSQESSKAVGNNNNEASANKPMSAWWQNFFCNTYCEDWPHYGRRNNRDAEQRLPTLKIAMLDNPQLLECDRIPELTFREKFATIRFVASVFGLTAQIAALMSLSKQFTNSVKNSQIKEVGRGNFEVASGILLYMPLIFALMIPFMYNTKRSMDAFYVCLSRGYLLDFPESLRPSFFVSHRVAILYVATILFYFVYAVLMFLWFQAEITIWIIFVNNVLFGLTLYWSDHFCVEGNLVSLSSFIQGVDDRGGENCVDQYTLSKASVALSKLKPLRTRCSYKEYTSRSVFRGSAVQQTLIRGSVFLAMGVFAAAMFGIFSFTANQEDQVKWKQQITPCAQVCFDHGQRNPDSCFNCMCDCATAFGTVFTQQYCMDWLNVPGCNPVVACAVYTNQTCGGRSA